MTNVVKLFQAAAFDPEEVETLACAYEKAKRSLHDRGQPDIVQTIIAERIRA